MRVATATKLSRGPRGNEKGGVVGNIPTFLRMLEYPPGGIEGSNVEKCKTGVGVVMSWDCEEADDFGFCACAAAAPCDGADHAGRAKGGREVSMIC